jgi:hypothetical protein
MIVTIIDGDSCVKTNQAINVNILHNSILVEYIDGKISQVPTGSNSCLLIEHEELVDNEH